MKSRQDGTGIPPYAAETRREIGTLGAGGQGNAETLDAAARRGVTPELAEKTARRFAEKRGGGEAGISKGEEGEN